MIQGISSYHAAGVSGVSGSDRPDVRQNNQQSQDRSEPGTLGFTQLLRREDDVRVSFSDAARRRAADASSAASQSSAARTDSVRSDSTAPSARTDSAQFSLEALDVAGRGSSTSAYEPLSRMKPRYDTAAQDPRPTARPDQVIAAYSKMRGESGLAPLGSGLSLSI